MKAVQFLEKQQIPRRLVYFYSSSKASFPFTLNKNTTSYSIYYVLDGSHIF